MPRRDSRHDILFEPVRIGPKTLRNRFYQVPHCTGFGTDKPESQARHRALKAEGGWAAVCTEYAPISPESDEKPYVSARLWDEGDQDALALMCEAVHEHGALAGIELHHGGSHSGTHESRWPNVAPSQIPDAAVMHGSVPKAMERTDISRVQEDWVAAARRARDAGFDIVYVYGGHGFLPLQFLSPRLNRRTDEYGGSLEGRARFWLETLAGVRDAVGDECAVAVRLSVNAFGPQGVELDEALEFIALADNLVDVWDATVGVVYGLGRRDSGASRFFGEGYQLEWSARVREVTAKPVIGVGRFTNPDTMADAVRRGELDIVGAARPSIADPFLPSKIEAGRYGEVRECIGCNFCYSRANFHHHLGCTQNATAGEEHRRGWHPERFSRAENADRDVLVLGAGPAGMECAIVLGKRGFRRVHLVEAEPEIGGSVRWIARLPGLGEWGRVAGWRRVQLDRLRNVDVLTGLRLSAEDVLTYGAEIVVVATGARWAADGLNGFTCEPIPGASAPHVLTPEQVMVEGRRPAGERVVVYDCDGYFMGSGLAEVLAGESHRVELVTPHDRIAPLADETLEGPFVRRRLHELGVGMRRGTVLRSIGPDGVLGEDEFGEPVELPADAVVLVTQRVSDEALYLELAAAPERLRDEGIEALYRVGDCLSPRLLGDAIFDGHRLAREIDSPDPAIPRPYLRERPASRPAISPPARVPAPR